MNFNNDFNNDFNDKRGITPTIIMTMVSVTLFVAMIFIIVLMANNNRQSTNVSAQNATNAYMFDTATYAQSSSSTITVGTGSPDDFDFWDKYPEETKTTESVLVSEPSKESVPPSEENDPSKDGKHTLVTYADGTEEWVLISPYLPKNDYDFTKLVCQSNIMKYFVNGKQTSYVGVDISKYQDYVDFVKVKKAGINFVMLRVGARGYGSGQLVLDEYFYDNIKRASDAGLEIGLYFSSQAVSVDEAVEEAQLVLENIVDYNITYPIAFRMEYVVNDTARIEELSRAEKTDIALAFLQTIEQEGYNTIIYGNKEWLIKEIDMSRLTDYDVWLSQISDLPDYPYKFSMWEYIDEATVDGISGYVSMNISFIDYTEK